MKTFLYILLIPILAVALSSCEEEESPILFSTESISNPENVKIEYFSPDPSCQPKSYRVWTNSQESELKIKCTNFLTIFLDDIGTSKDEYISTSGDWSAKLIDGNIIVFSFKKIDSDNVDESYSTDDGIYIYANNKKGQVSTHITVTRFTKMTEPLPQ